MATCKDCLYCEMCYLIEHYGADIDEEYADKDCKYFKDKSRFVEVVRCKDCIYHNVPPCPMRLSLNWTNDNDYCSYGERRSENENT